jgi:signal transduction histidine kinase
MGRGYAMIDAHTSSVTLDFPKRIGVLRVSPSLKSIVDALDRPLALLDDSGILLTANDAWRQSLSGACVEGENYLDWCETLDDATAGRRLVKGVKRVLSGAHPTYDQTVRAPSNKDEDDVHVRIRRIAHLNAGLCLISHEPAAVDDAELEDRILIAQVEERERLAADLHDTVGQDLVCIGLGLTRLRRLPTRRAEFEAVIAEMADALEHAHLEIRTMSFLLWPPWLDEPGAFTKAIRDLLDGFSRRTGLRSDLEVTGAPNALCRAGELTLFRVLQEALVNVHRHAHADSVEVTLAHHRKFVALTVRDDGLGMTAPEVAAPGVGLLSMRARLAKLGGDLRIASGPDGTTLVATLRV